MPHSRVPSRLAGRRRWGPGHEDDRNGIPAQPQLANHFGAEDVTKLDVDDEALRLADIRRGEEFCRRGVLLHAVAG